MRFRDEGDEPSVGMNKPGAWNPTASRRWTLWFLGLAGLWLLAGWLIIPAIIRSAFGGGLFGFLGGLMPGRNQHSVDVYLVPWAELVGTVLMGLTAVWSAGLVVLQPVTWRLTKATYLHIPTLGGRIRRRTMALVLALVTLTVAVQAVTLPDQWESARGFEYEWIASSLVDGHGFSFPPDYRWLVLDDEPGANEYGVTAWKEPVYPFFIAGSFTLFGPRYGRLAIVLCQIGFLLVTCILVYRLGAHLFGAGVGVVAALLTILRFDLHHITTLSMQIPTISSMLLVGGLLLLLRYGEFPSTRRAAWLGLYIGLAALTHAVLIVFVPISALFIVLHTRDQTWSRALRPALLMGLVAAAAISPWTIRNFAEFGHIIPVETGLGLFANAANPYVVETYRADIDACGDGSPPVFRADGPFDALRVLREEKGFTAIHQRAVACVGAANTNEYLILNEHERDGLHKKQFFQFVVANPLEFVKLTTAKTLLFLFDVPINGRGSMPLATLGMVGMMLIVRKPKMWVIPIVVLAYAAPFALTAPLYYRYQAPLEPVFALLAVVAVVTIFRGPLGRAKRVWISLCETQEVSDGLASRSERQSAHEA